MTWENLSLLVPTQDSSDNVNIVDGIGNKIDTHNSDSLQGKTKLLTEHAHGVAKVYPSLADGVQVSAGVGAWTLGSFVEIVPDGGIPSDFDIHYVSIENISANDVYELVLYNVTTEIGRVRFTKNANQDSILNVPMMTSLVPEENQIQAKLASSSGSNDVDITIFYHTY